MRTPQVSTRMAELGYEIVGNTPEEHEKQTKELIAFWIDVATRVKIL